MSRRRAAQVTAAAVVLVFLVLAVARNWSTIVESIRFDGRRFAMATVVALAGFSMLARSWAVLYPTRESRPSLLRRFLIAQPAKYVPGGLAMPASQVALSRGHDTSTGASVVRLVLHSAVMVASGCLLSVALVVSRPLLGMSVGAIGAIGLAILVGVSTQRLVDAMLALAHRVSSRTPVVLAVDTNRVDIAQCAAWAVGALAALGLAFVIIVESTVIDANRDWMSTFGAFELAWVVGFVLVPLPSGAGAREAVLGLLLAAGGPLGLWVAVSVIHRAALLVAEVLTAGWAVVVERRLRSNTRSAADRTTIP